MRKDLLKEWMAKNRLTMNQLARHLDVTPRTVYNRMQKGDFRAREIEQMIQLMHITNPSEVFFGHDAN
ncbi:MAG: helix-turn-helix transcriptional regulator [Clostridia bacterium]|jgi:transcriptional antiterminator|nr:helix-turn-helix transcriptional regulator [Clostridia bacterium]